MRGGVEVFGARQQFTVVDPGQPHHGASFDLAEANLCEAALALAYAEVVHRFAVPPEPTAEEFAHAGFPEERVGYED